MDRVLMVSAPAFCNAALPAHADSAEPHCAISQLSSQYRGCSCLAGAALGSPRPLPLSASGASHLETPNLPGGSLLIRRPGSLLHRRLHHMRGCYKRAARAAVYEPLMRAATCGPLYTARYIRGCYI